MIITIGGAYGSGGKPIAQRTAQLLGYQFCDDEIVQEALKGMDVDVAGATYRYFDEGQGGQSIQQLIAQSSARRQDYVKVIPSLTADVFPLDWRLAEAQKQVFQALADRGSCVLMGHCADHYLAGRADVIRVFVTDSQENCIARLREHFDIDENGARKLKKKVDKRREEYYSFFTGKEWGDMGNYDLVAHCPLLGVEGWAALLHKAVELKQGFK